MSAVDSGDDNPSVVVVLAVVAAVTAWSGWLSVSPAFGFPALATAAMFNRVLAPRSDPGSWPGWAILFIGLVLAALLYLALTDRGRLRGSLLSGVAYGVFCWLVAGAVVMPLLGFVDHTAPSAANDPMHGSFMMLSVGIGAPVTALIAWLIFGAVLGAVAAARRDEARTPRALAAGGALAGAAIVIGVLAAMWLGQPPADSTTADRVLASDPAPALPAGSSFLSVIELSQPPGASLGPHSHPYTGFAFSLRGTSTLAFTDGSSVAIGPGQVGLVAYQAGHTHVNRDDGTADIVIGLVILGLAAVVCVASLRQLQAGRAVLSGALVVLVAAGVLATGNPWSNDWLFLSVRPASSRNAIALPMPNSARIYESPDIAVLAGAAGTQSLQEAVIAPGSSTTASASTGAAVVVVLDGLVNVQVAGQPNLQLTTRGATLVNTGATAQLSDAGNTAAHVLIFAVTPQKPAG